MRLNDTVDGIQWLTYALLYLNLAAWIYLFKVRHFDRDLIIPILMVIIHVLAFYTCIIFLNWSFFDFTHWSQWVRLHTWSTALMVVVLIILRARKAKRKRAHG